MRTFAADMDAVRKKSGATPDTTAVASAEPTTKPQPVPKAMPASFDRPNPEKIKSTPAIKKEETERKETLKKISEAPIVITEPAAEKPIASTANSTIPAFHELQKSVSRIQENLTVDDTKGVSAKKSSKKEKVKNVPRPNIGYDATIITDTKSDRFQLFPSMIASLKKWFSKLKVERQKKAAPKYTIPEAERRKGVIQRATSKTGTIFTADSETLREQIRRRRIQEELEEEEPETVWSPFTEAGYALLESPEETPDTTQNVVLEYKRKPQLIEPNNPTLAIPKPTPTEASDVAEAEEEDFLIETKITEPDLLDNTLAEARWAASYEPTEGNPSAAEAPLTIPAYEDAPEGDIFLPPTQPIGYSAKNSTDTNTLTITLLVGIVGAIAIFFAARVLFTHVTNQTSTETEAVAVKSEPIITSAHLTGLPITVQTLNQIPVLLSKAIASSSGEVTEFAVVSGVGDEVSPSYLFEILHFDTKANLRQSLTAAHFVSVNHSKPGLILSFVDEDAVRGGLLQWEPHMYNNFNIFYGDIDSNTASFVDKKIDDIDVRVLVNAGGDEKLVYGFLSENSVLIVGASDDFSRISSQSQQ